MVTLTLAEMARRLGGEVSGGQVRCPGPGHSPADRSLSVKLNDKGNGVVVFSHSGDDVFACKDMVRAKLGLQPFKKTKSNGKDRKAIAATYDYVDEAGNLLFQVVRFAPKTFRQRKPDGNGKWTWKLGDVRRALFELPELIEGIAAGHPVFIVEGEKDVLALNTLGVVATTNPGGAGKWRSEYCEYLRGADVILAPDGDEVGWQHIHQVGAQLQGIAARVRVLVLPDLPPKGDVSDWIAAGGTREQLDDLVTRAPNWKPPSADDAAPSIDDKAAAAKAREDELIKALMGEQGLEFDRRIRDAAKELDVSRKALESEITKRREDAQAAPLYGHWIVEPAPGPVDGSSLLRDIIKRLKRHVIIRDDNALAIALWIVLSWAHDAVTHSPILNVTSAEPESGKSTTLNLIARLMPKCIASVEVSEAALYRAIERWHPSFCFDEFDSVLANDDKLALRSVINSGHTRGQGVMRCQGDDRLPEMFETFAPKAIGMVGKKTSASYLVALHLRRTAQTQTRRTRRAVQVCRR